MKPGDILCIASGAEAVATTTAFPGSDKASDTWSGTSYRLLNDTGSRLLVQAVISQPATAWISHSFETPGTYTVTFPLPLMTVQLSVKGFRQHCILISLH